VSQPEAPAAAPERATREAAAALLAELRAAGAERWDAAGLGVVDRLLAEAERAPGGLAAHLQARALVHAQHLEQDFARARERGAHALARLCASQHPGQPLAAQALARGDTFLPRRLLRHAPLAGPRLRDELRQHLANQLEAAAQARGISSPGLIEAPVVPSRGAARPLEMAQSLYRDAAAGASARLTLAKTAASVPQDAGRYHAVNIGARLLEEAARHPAYLKALLSRLDTLSVLWHHGALAPTAKPKKR
jgi:hypothetical protein